MFYYIPLFVISCPQVSVNLKSPTPQYLPLPSIVFATSGPNSATISCLSSEWGEIETSLSEVAHRQARVLQIISKVRNWELICFLLCHCLEEGGTRERKKCQEISWSFYCDFFLLLCYRSLNWFPELLYSLYELLCGSLSYLEFIKIHEYIG